MDISNGIVLTQAKSWLTSKTIWANVAGIIVSWLGVHHLPVDAETQSSLATVLLAAVNIGLRFVTKQPISVSLPGTPTKAVAVPAAVVSGWAALICLALGACAASVTPARVGSDMVMLSGVIRLNVNVLAAADPKALDPATLDRVNKAATALASAGQSLANDTATPAGSAPSPVQIAWDALTAAEFAYVSVHPDQAARGQALLAAVLAAVNIYNGDAGVLGLPQVRIMAPD